MDFSWQVLKEVPLHTNFGNIIRPESLDICGQFNKSGVSTSLKNIRQITNTLFTFYFLRHETKKGFALL